MNRMFNARNPYQGKAKRVLCVCSAGLLRSPTAAWILSNPPFSYNTRAAGIDVGHALVRVDDVLVHWADEIVCMTSQHNAALEQTFDVSDKKVLVLGVPDNYAFCDPELVKLITEAYRQRTIEWDAAMAKDVAEHPGEA